ncbi:hypothetical protein V8C42DRAFT_304645 [Trichoderma barbatum]
MHVVAVINTCSSCAVLITAAGLCCRWVISAVDYPPCLAHYYKAIAHKVPLLALRRIRYEYLLIHSRAALHSPHSHSHTHTQTRTKPQVSVQARAIRRALTHPRRDSHRLPTTVHLIQPSWDSTMPTWTHCSVPSSDIRTMQVRRTKVVLRPGSDPAASCPVSSQPVPY